MHFIKYFEADHYTDQAVEEVAKASSLLRIAQAIPKIYRGIKAVGHSMPEIKNAARAIMDNYARSSTAVSNVTVARSMNSNRPTGFNVNALLAKVNTPSVR